MSLLRTAVTILLVLAVVPAPAAAQRTGSTTAPPPPAVAAARLEATIAVDGRLEQVRADWDERPAVGVVMAAGGYPGAYRKNDEIQGLGAAPVADIKVFHAGTALAGGRVVTAGGRVLCVCALGPSVRRAQHRAYETVAKIRWDGAQYRRDIAYRAIEREK